MPVIYANSPKAVILGSFKCKRQIFKDIGFFLFCAEVRLSLLINDRLILSITDLCTGENFREETADSKSL